MLMKDEDIKILEKLSKTTRNWSPRTKNSYTTAVNQYTKFNGKSLTELIKEAETDEKNKIRWKDRKLRNRLLTFRVHLYDTFVLKTAQAYFKRIWVIYKDLEIELHDLPPISDINVRKNPPIYFEDLPTNLKIRMACDVSDPLMNAILIFMSSSGQAKKETLNITIEDFINATEMYHNIEILDITNECSDVELLNKVLMKLIPVKEEMYPIFKVKRQKTNKYYKFCCSDEATRAIVNYLLTRNDKINLDKRLFKTNSTYLHERFKDINKKLGWGQFESGINKFTSHMLRKFNASNLTKSIKNKDQSIEKGMDLKDVDALQGRSKKGSSKSYYLDDFEAIRQQYIYFSKRLKIYTNDDFRTDEYKELEKQLQKELTEKNKIISNMAGENIQLKKDNEDLKSVKEELNEKTKSEKVMKEEINDLKKTQDLILEKLN